MSDDMTIDESNENNPSGQIEATVNPKHTKQLDTAFDCLRSARSRHLLYYLYDKDETAIPIEEAVEAVQEYEAATMAIHELPSRQAIRLDLINSHLPRLMAAGVLNHDPRRGEVQFDGNPLVEEWLDRSRQFELD